MYESRETEDSDLRDEGDDFDDTLVIDQEDFSYLEVDDSHEADEGEVSDFNQHHLGMVMSNPVKVKLLKHFLPDFTANKRYTLNQGRKWKDNYHFQAPMVPKELFNTEADYWVGDVVYCRSTRQYQIIDTFFTMEQNVFATCYPVTLDDNNRLLLLTYYKVNIPLSNMTMPYMSIQELEGRYDICSLQLTVSGQIEWLPRNCLSDIHLSMIQKALGYRNRVPTNLQSGRHLKVRVVLLSLFSDDTSGNRSKKWNCYGTWMMNVAAFDLTDSNKYENHYFLCTSNHSINAREMTGPLGEDLCQLERGQVMYDAILGEDIFVIAPVLFFRGDNVRQAKLALNKGSMAKHPCRYCYWQADPFKPIDATGQPVALRYSAGSHLVQERTWIDFRDFVRGAEERNGRVHLLNSGRVVRLNGGTNSMTPSSTADWSNLSFKLTGAEVLLNLNAVDLSKDLPVEILHTILLGMTKYCLKISMQYFIQTKETDSLTLLFRNYNSPALHRNLTSSLKMYRSFLGGDFKILVQLLPSLLQRARNNSPQLSTDHDSFSAMFECFNKLAALSSLVYMQKIDNFDQYKLELDTTVAETMTAIDNLQHTTTPIAESRRTPATRTTAIQRMNFSSLCNRLKAHLLIHLSQDADRIGGAVHTEAERCEQHHKFMRELLCHTNRQNGGRDVARKFAEEYMLCHTCEGGRFVDCFSGVWETCCPGVIASYDPVLVQSGLVLADNTNSSKKLKVGLAALFYNRHTSSKTSGLTLGVITAKQGDELYVQAYDFVLAAGEAASMQSRSIFDCCVQDIASNFIVVRLPRDDFVLNSTDEDLVVEVFDMSQSLIMRAPQRDSLSVNKSKFGTRWWLKNTTYNFEKIVY
ncbi:hypothetical protein BDB00DRAFT_941448 [Zychaea mexicana]|uniref:uncharacterized protein n=1 Tax=Zychaea mexicana TaxID=64656 RepID=UPI0022FED6D0|nr:uncharacterized protein BDB00DRAFT_941448 [Zychaea mexicana]KAI9489728.1 hypothetical protein BDB00DRAFT_941448 [Zychaea mexicana]